MAKHWKVPIDRTRHLDHFCKGAPRLRSDAHDSELAYFVNVAGFTFEFASLDQLRAALVFFDAKNHPSSRTPVFEPEKGEWQDWHERLPAKIRGSHRRERVLSALRAALLEFEREQPSTQERA